MAEVYGGYTPTKDKAGKERFWQCKAISEHKFIQPADRTEILAPGGKRPLAIIERAKLGAGRCPICVGTPTAPI